MNQENFSSFRKMKMLCHILRALGYQRQISLDSFRKPNFRLVADILFWLCKKLDKNCAISANINTEVERTNFLKQSLGILISKTRVQIDPIKIYYSDYRAVDQLLEILNLLYKGIQNENQNTSLNQDFNLPYKFDKRKTKELSKEIISHGQAIYEMLGKENQLQGKMDKSIEILEKILSQYNNSTVTVEEHVKKLIGDQMENTKEIEEYLKKIQKKEKDLIDKIRRKKMEQERLEKKLKSLQNIKPAYVEEMERCEGELERIFQIYINKQRNLDYLEEQFEIINENEEKRNSEIKVYLEKMQIQIQKNEEKMFENHIDELQLKNLKMNPIIEEDEDYAMQLIFKTN